MSIQPVREEDFDLQFLYAEEAKSRGTLEEQASVTDLGLRHMAYGDPQFAQRVQLDRAKAIAELDRRRLIAQATAKAEAARREQHEGPRDDEDLDAFVKRNPAYPVRVDFLAGCLDAITEILKEKNGQIIELEKRIHALETQPDQTLKFCGAWDAQQDYSPNDVVHSGGSAWVSTMKSASVRPGTDNYASQCWSLFVSRGREGRPGRDAQGRA